jgi:hypothetical protein
MKYDSLILRSAIAALLSLGCAVFCANASVLAFPLVDNSGGVDGSPSLGMQVNAGLAQAISHGACGNGDFFSFQDAYGASTVTLSIDSETGRAIVSGQVRHGSIGLYGTQYSGEIWNYEATLRLQGDWSKQGLEGLSNDPAALGTLNLMMESSTFQLANGRNAGAGYNGPTQWTGDATTAGSGHQLNWGAQSTFKGWFAPFGYDGPSMQQDFRCLSMPDPSVN